MVVTSIDAKVIEEWAGKFEHFAKKDTEMFGAIILVHQNRTPAYYRELFALEFSHYPGKMTSPQEIKRYVTSGALMAYAAHKILCPED